MSNRTDEIASKFLGKKVTTDEKYNPSFLVRIPRAENRLEYGIQNTNLPFSGFDIWQNYEFSALSENGLPVTRFMKMYCDCSGEFLVESKSLKLYLNSFNMSRFGKNPDECLEICKNIIEKDLSEKLETQIKVKFLDNSTKRTEIFQDFENLMNFVDPNKLKTEKFKEAPEVLEFEKTKTIKEYRLTFDSLRSNCRVTHQPDFGDVFIYYKSDRHLKEESLLKYLCSFRSEFHFHEECCEMIYKRLYDLLKNDDALAVAILYTRRGGIDISPVRMNRKEILTDISKLADINLFARYGIKQ